MEGVTIHEAALVDPGAEVGAGTRVWAFAHILQGAVVGRGCNICDYVFIESGVSIGDGVTIKNSVQVFEGVDIEDDVFVGPNTTFTNDRTPRSFTVRDKADWLERTSLRRGCSIGAGSTIVCGVTIGQYALIGAGSVVTQDVPAYSLVVGNPARSVRWICRCGSRLSFDRHGARCCDLSYELVDGLVREI